MILVLKVLIRSRDLKVYQREYIEINLWNTWLSSSRASWLLMTNNAYIGGISSYSIMLWVLVYLKNTFESKFDFGELLKRSAGCTQFNPEVQGT